MTEMLLDRLNTLHAVCHFSDACRYTAQRYATLKWLRHYTALVLFTSESSCTSYSGYISQKPVVVHTGQAGSRGGTSVI